MKNILVAIVALVAFAFAGVANAAEIKGFIKSINNRTIVIQTNNAGQVNAPAGIEAQTITIDVPTPGAGQTDMMVGISPGMTITVTYTTAGTGAAAKNTASKIVR